MPPSVLARVGQPVRVVGPVLHDHDPEARGPVRQRAGEPDALGAVLVDRRRCRGRDRDLERDANFAATIRWRRRRPSAEDPVSGVGSSRSNVPASNAERPRMGPVTEIQGQRRGVHGSSDRSREPVGSRRRRCRPSHRWFAARRGPCPDPVASTVTVDLVRPSPRWTGPSRPWLDPIVTRRVGLRSASTTQAPRMAGSVSARPFVTAGSRGRHGRWPRASRRA